MIAEALLDRSLIYAVMVLLCIGLYGMLAKRNLAKKLVGMVIFQTAIYLFFILGATKLGGTVPILDEQIGLEPERYVNPLPHLLILTALVVGVGVLGVALSFLLRIYRRHGTFDEDRIVAELSADLIEGHGVDPGGDPRQGHEPAAPPDDPATERGEEPPA